MKTVEKLKMLDAWLRSEHGIGLYRAISVREEKMEEILKGEEEPSKKILQKISSYFFIPIDALTDDTKDLPDPSAFRLDEDLLSVQRNDVENDLERQKHRHYIQRNWSMIGYRKRVRLILSILLITIPLVAFIGYCVAEATYERFDDMYKYEIGSDGLPYDRYDENQARLHESLTRTSKENDPDAYYVEVKVGTVLEKIKNIHSESSGYDARMQLYFKFDKDEFRDMFRHYARNVLLDQVINDYYTTYPDETMPAEPFDHSLWADNHSEWFEYWVETNDSRFYPGETPSNVLTDKETMFTIGNGDFVPDYLGTLKELEEVQYYDENGNLRTMIYQKLRFTAAFEKAFDSVRYPLDSVQFKMYIHPTMDAAYMRYVPDYDTTEEGNMISGFSPFFSVTSGYRVINPEKADNFTLRLNYYYDENNDPSIAYEHTVKTQLEIIVRANRQGLSLFLQAFINLFSVVIWIIIAFYSQSYTGEDSVGMLGTGLFGVISSMLVGLSMVSDAGIFSLITMINIFTLAVIMIMTYQAIAAKRAQVRNDKVLIAYNGVKLRVLFIVLTIATAIMFIVLPLISYMWGY